MMHGKFVIMIILKNDFEKIKKSHWFLIYALHIFRQSKLHLITLCHLNTITKLIRLFCKRPPTYESQSKKLKKKKI